MNKPSDSFMTTNDKTSEERRIMSQDLSQPKPSEERMYNFILDDPEKAETINDAVKAAWRFQDAHYLPLLAQRDAEIAELKNYKAAILEIQKGKFREIRNEQWFKDLSEDAQSLIMAFWEGASEWEDEAKEARKDLKNLRSLLEKAEELKKAALNIITCRSPIENTSSCSIYNSELEDLFNAVNTYNSSSKAILDDSTAEAQKE